MPVVTLAMEATKWSRSLIVLRLRLPPNNSAVSPEPSEWRATNTDQRLPRVSPYSPGGTAAESRASKGRTGGMARTGRRQLLRVQGTRCAGAGEFRPPLSALLDRARQALPLRTYERTVRSTDGDGDFLGFVAVDYLAKTYGFEKWKSDFWSSLGDRDWRAAFPAVIRVSFDHYSDFERNQSADPLKRACRSLGDRRSVDSSGESVCARGPGRVLHDGGARRSSAAPKGQAAGAGDPT